MVKSRQQRKNVRKTMKKGGFSNSSNLWSHNNCKTVIQLGRMGPVSVIKNNWRECIKYLANHIGVSPEELYNKITPDEYLMRIGAGKWVVDKYLQDKSKQNQSRSSKGERNSGSVSMKMLPGTEFTEEEQAQANAETNAVMNMARQEQAEVNAQIKRAISRRVKGLEEGISPYASEEIEGNPAAIYELVNAARRGKSARIARRLKEGRPANNY